MRQRLSTSRRFAYVAALVVLSAGLAMGMAPGVAAQTQAKSANAVSPALIERLLEREIARVAGKSSLGVSREELVRAVVQRLAAERSRTGEFRSPSAAVAAVNTAVCQVVGRALRSQARTVTESIVVHASSISTDERSALIDLYNSTNGASWTNSLAWNGAAGTECGWAGVTCDAGITTVLRVDLHNNNLVGTLPASLGSLSNLTYLDLSLNQLTGSIPTQLGSLTNLQQLFLQYNQLSGPIPAQLGSLANLQALDLSFNQLSSTIPAQFGDLIAIQDLELDANQLTGPIPAQFDSLRNLLYLSLEQNQLSGSIPDLSNLTSLQFLGLSSNQLSGSVTTQFGSLTALASLDLDSNQLSGSIPDLSTLAVLNFLGLSSNQFSGPIPTWLGNLASLATLDLGSNQLSGAIPTQLGTLTNLEFLYLPSNQLVGAVPAGITGLTNLVAGLSDFRWNGVYSADPSIAAFLAAAQYGGDWQSTQTVAPAGVAVGAVTSTSVELSWTPIAYTGGTGGYQAYDSTTSGGPYAAGGITGDKNASAIVVGGLTPGAAYYFVLRTVSNPNPNNQNTVTSDPSGEVSTTTSCTWPSIISQPQGATVWSGMVATLSVTATGTAPLSYQWYEGASGDTSNPVGLNVDPFTTPLLAATTSFWVRVSNPCAHVDSTAATVTVGSAPAFAVWVPVASHANGLNQSQWRSDLGLLNTGAVGANVQGVFYGSNGVVAGTTYVEPGTQSIVTDVVGLLGASGSGALAILADQPLKVTARTYDQVSSGASCDPDGTLGQDYPTVLSIGGLSTGQSAVLAGLTENASYRCNIGLVNTGTVSATVLVGLFSGAGTEIGSYTAPLTTGQWAQATQPFLNEAGQTAMDAGYATITVQTGAGVFAFASVIDNVTNDPTTVAMQGLAPALVVWVPVASHASGLDQSQWRSDLGLLNPGTVTANVQGVFYGGDGVVTGTTTVAPGAQAILTDVVGQLGASGSGALEVVSDQPIELTARSYNQVASDASCYPDGTEGQDYPAVVLSGGLSAGQSAVLAGLTENASYRCNIGLVNTGTASAIVLVGLFSGAGTAIGSYTVPLTAGQWAQATQPFLNEAGQTAMDAGYATITVQTGSGVFAFASVIDNITNDPTTVAMQR